MTNKEYSKEYYKNNKIKFREYGRVRREKLGEEYNEIIKKWRKENPEKQRAIQDKYVKKYKINNMEKIKAQQKTQSIKIPNGTKCKICKTRLAIEKHHPDYSKPTKLIFLCRKCHKEITPNAIKTDLEKE